MPYVNNKGVNIYYQIEGNGPPLVMHHWSFATLKSWYDYGYVSHLKDKYQLILFDSRGHGASDKLYKPSDYTLKKRVMDITTILDNLHIDKAHFIGYSMGGWVGFGITQYAPERFLSLTIGGQHPYAKSLESNRKFASYGIEHGPDTFISKWEKEIGILPPNQKKQIHSYDFKSLLVVAQDRLSQETVLPSIKLPCLLYAGKKDKDYHLIQKCVNIIPDVIFVPLPDIDHGGVIRHSELVVPIIKKFLSERIA